jgi:hypothetical protein
MPQRCCGRIMAEGVDLLAPLDHQPGLEAAVGLSGQDPPSSDDLELWLAPAIGLQLRDGARTRGLELGPFVPFCVHRLLHGDAVVCRKLLPNKLFGTGSASQQGQPWIAFLGGELVVRRAVGCCFPLTRRSGAAYGAAEPEALELAGPRTGLYCGGGSSS